MIKGVANFLLDLIMSVLVLGLIVIIFISNTVFSPKYIREKLDENRFYERTYNDIIDDCENYTIQSGLELDILDGLFTQEKVIDDINSKIDYIYTGKAYSVETASIRNELDSRINSALEKNNRVPSDYEKESIARYEDAIEDCYSSGILYGRDFRIDTKYLDLARIVCISGIIAISIVLIIINRSLLKYVSLIGINLLFSGVLCASLKALLERRVQHILILDAKFSNFLVKTLNEMIGEFFKIGIIAIVLGLVLIIIGSLEKNKKTIENKTN